MKKNPKVKQGRINKRHGREFELLVRKDLESKGWIVAKWSNNVELVIETKLPDVKCEDKSDGNKLVTITEYERMIGKLIPAKHKFSFFSKVMTMGTGFPDFIAYKIVCIQTPVGPIRPTPEVYDVIGVECKGGDKVHKYLDKEEKQKCKWLLDNDIFSKILIANYDYPDSNINLPSKKRVKKQIKYEEFKWE